jgi:hypothetical protein
MFSGALIMESLRAGTRLPDLNVTVREIYRFRPEGTAAYQPDTWSVVELEVSDADMPMLAERLAVGLLEPGWYASFRSPVETFIVFPGRVFRYPRGDEAGRTEAQAHGRIVGVPERQLDWRY